MALPLSVSTLLRKRDEKRDSIAAHAAKLNQAQADLAQVLAALRLFDASGQPEDFSPYMDLNRGLRRGETTTARIANLAGAATARHALTGHPRLADRQPFQGNSTATTWSASGACGGPLRPCIDFAA